jgi:hypothetical protein
VSSTRAVLVEFTRRLRAEGVPVPPATAADLAAAADLVGLQSAEDTYHAFRSLTVSAPEHIPVYDRVFSAFFGRWSADIAAGLVEERPRTWVVELPKGGDADQGEEETGESVATYTGASEAERLARRDFDQLTPAEVIRLRALIAQMIWRPAAARSRRRRPAPAGDRPDLRRTFRRSLGAEGAMMELAMSERRRRRRPLIFIADVSGSMERYSEMLLYFAHAARGRLGRLEAFVFSTHLTRITRPLLRRDPSVALTEVSHTVTDWSGGTRIGAALRTFNVEWSRRVVRGGPVAVIVSDGWDRGDPELLVEEMARLRRSVYRVIWLNPLAGRAGYAPETRGMRAALPYIDDFLPAANLIDLGYFVDLLDSLPAHR